MTTREIVTTLQELYDTVISATLVSKVQSIFDSSIYSQPISDTQNILKLTKGSHFLNVQITVKSECISFLTLTTI